MSAPTACISCPEGKNGGGSQGTCTQCPYNKFSNVDTVNSLSNCQECERGSMPAVQSLNQYAIIGANTCLTCPVGKYWDYELYKLKVEPCVDLRARASTVCDENCGKVDGKQMCEGKGKLGATKALNENTSFCEGYCNPTDTTNKWKCDATSDPRVPSNSIDCRGCKVVSLGYFTNDPGMTYYNLCPAGFQHDSNSVGNRQNMHDMCKTQSDLRPQIGDTTYRAYAPFGAPKNSIITCPSEGLYTSLYDLDDIANVGKHVRAAAMEYVRSPTKKFPWQTQKQTQIGFAFDFLTADKVDIEITLTDTEKPLFSVNDFVPDADGQKLIKDYGQKTQLRLGDIIVPREAQTAPLPTQTAPSELRSLAVAFLTGTLTVRRSKVEHLISTLERQTTNIELHGKRNVKVPVWFSRTCPMHPTGNQLATNVRCYEAYEEATGTNGVFKELANTNSKSKIPGNEAFLNYRDLP